MKYIEAIAVGVERKGNGARVSDEVAVVLRLPPGATIQKGDLLVQAPRNPRPWNATTWYREGDKVIHAGYLWRCLNDHRSGEPGKSGEILWCCLEACRDY